MAVNEQLPEIAFGRRGNPDFRKTFREQQVKYQRGVALVGFLLAHATGASPGGVPDPQLVAAIRKQSFERVNGAGGLEAPAPWRLQTPGAGGGFGALVVQPA